MADLLDLYSDYLLSSLGQTSATGLSALLDGAIKHDKITQFLSGNTFSSKDLWLQVKPLVRRHESAEACLVFDDVLIEKAYMDENELICWHWDHAERRSVKGINLLTAFYVSSQSAQVEPLRIPIAYELVLKTILFCELSTRKVKRQSPLTKNEMMQQMIEQAMANQVKFGYVLADTWFASSGNMRFIHGKKKHFIFDLKDNRLAVLSEQDRNQGQWKRIDELDLPDNMPVSVWLKDLDIALLLVKQVFTNQDLTTGVRFLVSNQLDLPADQFFSLYKKRWSVEEYHKSIKQNASIAKSPARTVTTQSNHLFAALFAYVKLEQLKLAHQLNHFALKTKIYQAALRGCFEILFGISSYKDVDKGELEHSLGAFSRFLKISAQAPFEIEPTETAFHYPSPTSRDKAFRTFWLLYYFYPPAVLGFNALDKAFLVAFVYF